MIKYYLLKTKVDKWSIIVLYDQMLSTEDSIDIKKI